MGCVEDEVEQAGAVLLSSVSDISVIASCFVFSVFYCICIRERRCNGTMGGVP